MVKAWFFDCQGSSIISYFRSKKEAEHFAENHGLELWNWRESKAW